MTIKIPTSTFLEIQSDLADWLMSTELGQDVYSTMLEMHNNSETINQSASSDCISKKVGVGILIVIHFLHSFF